MTKQHGIAAFCSNFLPHVKAEGDGSKWEQTLFPLVVLVQVCVLHSVSKSGCRFSFKVNMKDITVQGTVASSS